MRPTVPSHLSLLARLIGEWRWRARMLLRTRGGPIYYQPEDPPVKPASGPYMVPESRSLVDALNRGVLAGPADALEDFTATPELVDRFRH